MKTNRIVHVQLTVLATALAVLAPGLGFAADLVIRGESDRTVDGGSYENLIIENSSNVTVRNATFTVTGPSSVADIIASHNVVLENSDLNGTDVACTGIRVRSGSTDVTIRNNDIHNIADDGLEVYSVTGFKLLDNRIYSLMGIGTDGNINGPCFNGHSDGIELFHVVDSEITGNLVYDVRWVAAIFISNDAQSSATYCRNMTIANNVFFTPESGFVGYIYQVDGLKVTNNVFWKGKYGGIAMGDNVTNMDFENNIVHSLNYNHTKVPYDAANHRFKNNIVATTDWQASPQVFGPATGDNRIVLDPGFVNIPADNAFTDVTAFRQETGAAPRVRLADFALREGSVAIDAGLAANAPPLDALGEARPYGSAPDIGAVEYRPAQPPADLLPPADVKATYHE